MRHLHVLFILFLFAENIYGQEKIIKNITLNEAIELGLKNNPSIKAAQENISVSKGQYLSGISLPQPEISFDREWIPFDKSGSLSENTISISQSFEFPSIYFLKGDKFSKAEEIAVYRLRMIERTIGSQIKTAYYKVLAEQFHVKSDKEYLLISEDFYKKAEIRQNVGEGTNLERLTAKVQYTEALNNVEVAKNELAIAYSELNFILGFGKQNNNSVFSITDSLVFVEFNINEDQILKSYEISNPQIKIAELNYEIASIEKSIANSSFLPNINLAFSKQSRDGDNGFYGTSAGISLPLWFMFEQKGKIQEASANQSIKEYDLQLLKNEIALKLQNAITDYENDLKQVQLYVNDILPQSEEILRTAIKSYNVGELTYLEYLQAKQTLVNSRNNFNLVMFNYYQSLFRIEEISGQNIINK
jgi:outer membrane protein TolC